MAQSGFTPISIYYSTTASAVPTAANLVQGELAINTNDGKLYYEDSSGVVQVLATKSTGSIGGSNTQVQFNNSGSLGGSSSFTWDGTTVTATKFAGALNGTVGATTASTGAFTTINASTSITNAALTSGRVTYAGASGLLSDSAGLTYDGTNLTTTGTATATRFIPSGSTVATNGMYLPAANNLGFSTNSTLRATIDSSGNLGLGVTPSAWGTSWKAFQIGTNGASLATHPTLLYTFLGSNWYQNGPNDKYITSNTAGILSMNGNVFAFLQAPSGTAGDNISFTQAMTLNSVGNLLVGTTTDLIWNTTNLTGCVIGGNASTGGYSSIQVSRSGDACLLLNRLGSDGSIVAFARQGTEVGNISVTTTLTSYNVTSDYRLKENIAPMTGALSTVTQLKPVTYKWKADGSDGQGFIAHELQAVVPDCVTGEKDAVDENGKPVYQAMDTSHLIATLVSAIQEQQALIESLTTRLTALENK